MKKIALLAAAGLMLASVAAIAQMQPPRSAESPLGTTLSYARLGHRASASCYLAADIE